MSITISFSMKPKKYRLPGQERRCSRLAQLAKNMERELGYCCEVVQDMVVYHFCPEGFLWMGWQDGKIIGDCQTNIAGPGFHAAVIHFLELFASRAEFKLFVRDVTGYYEERDFTKMRNNYFYRWFSGLMERVLEKPKADSGQLVCWPANYYLPEEKSDLVTTHIRPFTLTEISRMLKSGISMAFAKDFFVWNEEEKDAYYYRNSALVMLNQECYFMPSDRSREDRAVNQKIIGCLERALKMDPLIPFPKKEYLELCRLAGKEPVPTGRVTEYAGAVTIGCRRGLLFRTIGCMRFAVPGHFLYDAKAAGHSEHYYDGDEKSPRDYYICAVDTGEPAVFQEEPFQKSRIKEIQEFCAGPAKGKLAVYQPDDRTTTAEYSVAAQIIYKTQLTIISIHYHNPGDFGWAADLIRKVRTID